jgi:hypothetical protein
MAEFKAGRNHHLTVVLEAFEADILRGLIEKMRVVLDAGDRKDPVTARLFPPAYDESGDAEAFRELIGDELKNAKLQAVNAVEDAIGTRGAVDTSLSPEAVDDWLRALNDMRLAIGTRLDVTEDRMEEDPDPADPDAPALSVLHWLAWMQESMLYTLTGGR